jgi:hypothetical protein
MAKLLVIDDEESVSQGKDADIERASPSASAQAADVLP